MSLPCPQLTFLRKHYVSGDLSIEKGPPLFGHQLHRTNVRAAADRENSFRHGFAISEEGKAYNTEECPWYPLAVRPGGLGWLKQVEDLREAVVYMPQLVSVWLPGQLRPASESMRI